MFEFPFISGMPLPTKEEINPVKGYLDGQTALKHFYGKSQSEAAKLFFEYSIGYTDDLYAMGGKAFCFYFPTLEPYLLSQESEDDPCIIDAMAGILEHRIQFDSPSIKGCLVHVLRMLTYVSENIEKFNADPDLFGDLAGRLKNLIEQVRAMDVAQE